MLTPESPAPFFKTAAHPLFPLACVVMTFFVLPRFGGVAMTLGCAWMVTAQLGANPEIWRSRSGSLKPALGLVAFMWLAAAAVGVLSLRGVHVH